MKEPTPGSGSGKRTLAIGLLCSERPGCRAMTAIAALYLAAADLLPCEIVPIGQVTPNVDIALQALAYDTGIEARPAWEGQDAAGIGMPADIDLLLGVARRSFPAASYRRAVKAGIPQILVAEESPGFFRRKLAVPPVYAYDTRALAALIVAVARRNAAVAPPRQSWVRRIARKLEPSPL